MRGHSNLRPSPRPANSMEQDSFDSFEDDTNAIEDELLQNLTNQSLRLNGSTNNETSPSGGRRGPRQAIGIRGRGSSAGSEESRSPGAESMSGLGPDSDIDRDIPEELPKSIIVTNVDLSVFDDDGIKSNFENMFRNVDGSAIFHYLRSFRRIRVDFETHAGAYNAKVGLDSTSIGDSVIHCYFIQVLSPCNMEDAYLHVPPLTKQFLISPPSSPPVGWEQPREDKPNTVIDYDIISAMASLAPGEQHELHSSRQINVLGKSISTPSIVVHIAHEEENAAANNRVGEGAPSASGAILRRGASEDGEMIQRKRPAGSGAIGVKMKPTRCPERQSSLE